MRLIEVVAAGTATVLLIVASACAPAAPPPLPTPIGEQLPLEERVLGEAVPANPAPPPEPELRDRWRSPFAVSSAGKIAPRRPRTVIVLGEDSVIAAGRAALARQEGTPPASTERDRRVGRGSGAGATAPSTGSSVAAVAGGGSAAAVAVAADSDREEVRDRDDPAGRATRVGRPDQGDPDIGENRASDRSAADATFAGDPRGAPSRDDRGDREADTRDISEVSRTSTAPGMQTASEGRASIAAAPARAEEGSGDVVDPPAARETGTSTLSPGAPAVASEAPPRSSRREEEDQEAGSRTHRVAAGDTWIEIALEYEVSYSGLVAANPGVNPDRIRIGQLLQIPPSGEVAPRARRITHRVRPGDTLSGLAQRYSVPTQRIREANDIEGDRIRIGQDLVIPVTD